MSDLYLPLLKRVIFILRNNSNVRSYIAQRTYTEVPQQEVFPYAVVSIDSSDWSAKDFSGQEHSLQVDIYSRASTPQEASAARNAIYNALNRQEDIFTLDSGRVISVNFTSGVVFKEPDGVVWHAVVQFRVVTSGS